MNRVVITGLGLQSPIASELSVFRKALLEGSPSFKSVPNPVLADESFLIVGECDEIDRKRLQDRKVQKVTTKKDILGLIAAFDSIKDACIEKGKLDPDRVGIFTGAASTHVSDLLPYQELLEKTAHDGIIDVSEFGRNLIGTVNPMVMMQTLMNNVLCYVSIPFDVRGVNANFMDYQAAGLRAIGEGYWAIKEGRADQVIAGGVSGAPDLYHAAEGIDLGYLFPAVQSSDAETDVVKPFDDSRKGTVLSEAAGFCVLESLESAEARGVKIYGEVTGFTTNSEANFHYVRENEGEAMRRCFEDHLQRFDIDPAGKVAAVYSHANGSRNGDDLDIKVLNQVFSGRAKPLPLTSIKAVTGETNEASGILSLIDALSSLSEGVIPGVHNFQAAANMGDFLSVSTEAQSIEGSQILVSAKGFSGVNALISVISV